MKRYLITLLALLTFYGAQAQEGEIIYIEYEPKWDTLKPQEPLYYDIDLDGENDIKVWEICDLFNRVYGEIRPISDSRLLASKLSDSVSLADTTLFWYFVGIPDDKWVNPNVYHLGYKIENEGDVYYGWLKMLIETAPNWDKVYVKTEKTCFCTIPNYPIRWGQTSLDTGFWENENTASATIHPNPTNSTVTVTGRNLKSAEVLNLLGQCVATATGKGETMQIDMAKLPVGVYFVNVTDAEGRKYVRKVVKE